MLSQEIAVQFLNLGHQIGVEPSDLHSGSSKPKLTATAYPIIRIESSNNNSLDSPFDYSVGTGNLGMVSGGTRLQCRKECRPRQRLVGQLPLKQRELCVLSRAEFSTKSRADHNAIAGDKGPHFR
jgi:hypothetical protein